MLSLNGSPLVNPYQFGSSWFKGSEVAENAANDEGARDANGVNANGQLRTLKRTKSSIIIRKDPSLQANGRHSRTDSQLSLYAPTETSLTLSREPSQSLHSYPGKPPSYSSQFPNPPAPLDAQTTPKIKPHHSSSFSALIAVPTRDGHLLEFDPLQTSPGALEALDGISDSAKKQARLEVGHLVQAAVEKWKVS